jgi:hypothetical protein
MRAKFLLSVFLLLALASESATASTVRSQLKQSAGDSLNQYRELFRRVQQGGRVCSLGILSIEKGLVISLSEHGRLAGLKVGDTIERINGSASTDVTMAVLALDPDDEVELELRRDSATENLTVPCTDGTERFLLLRSVLEAVERGDWEQCLARTREMEDMVGGPNYGSTAMKMGCAMASRCGLLSCKPVPKEEAQYQLEWAIALLHAKSAANQLAAAGHDCFLDVCEVLEKEGYPELASNLRDQVSAVAYPPLTRQHWEQILLQGGALERLAGKGDLEIALEAANLVAPQYKNAADVSDLRAWRHYGQAIIAILTAIQGIESNSLTEAWQAIAAQHVPNGLRQQTMEADSAALVDLMQDYTTRVARPIRPVYDRSIPEVLPTGFVDQDIVATYRAVAEQVERIEPKSPFETDAEYQDRTRELFRAVDQIGDIAFVIEAPLDTSISFDMDRELLAVHAARPIHGEYAVERKYTELGTVIKQNAMGAKLEVKQTIGVVHGLVVACEQCQLTLEAPMSRDLARSLTTVRDGEIHLNPEELQIILVGRLAAPYVKDDTIATEASFSDIVPRDLSVRTYSLVVERPTFLLVNARTREVYAAR